MLAEAIQLLLSTVFVFHVQTTAQTVGLIVAAWSKSLPSFFTLPISGTARAGPEVYPKFLKKCFKLFYNTV